MKIPVFTILSLLVLGTASSFGAVLVDYNFNALSTGALAGQDGWTVGGTGVSSPSVAAAPSTANYVGSNAASTSAAAGVAMTYNIEFAPGAVTNSSVVRLEFDVYRPSGAPIAFMGIGQSSSTYAPAYFGISGNTFQFRASGFGTVSIVNGAIFNPAEWYTVAMDWNIATGTATMYAKNLTNPSATAWQTNTTDAGDGWRQLYFGAGLTNPTVTLGIPGSGTGSVANWDSAYIRMTPTGAGTSYLDNISVEVVPEPGTSLLLGFAASSLLIFRRRRN
jgi:hypothetical protein